MFKKQCIERNMDSFEEFNLAEKLYNPKLKNQIYYENEIPDHEIEDKKAIDCFKI